jgi:glutamyl-Q tRNA(Asp) synthetase
VSAAKGSSAIATTGIAELSPAARRGRFAPSPTGPLHFGSLVAAVGSFLDARSRGGAWFLRIDALDPPRERPGAVDDILRTLERLALHWDGAVLKQSNRGAAYAEALEVLREAGRLRECHCSRAQLAALPQNRDRPPGEEHFHPPACIERASAATDPALRFRVEPGTVDFLDRVQGMQSQDVSGSTGDFVVRRRDGLWAYQLAVVVDDAAQGITDVVRGADLLGSTARQIQLQSVLGLPRPTYMHLPLAVDASGVKLSKSDDAPAIAGGSPAAAIVSALEFLRQGPPEGLASATAEDVLAWALGHWQPSRISGMYSRKAPAGVLRQGMREGWE